MPEVPQQLKMLKQALPIPSGGLKLLYAILTIAATLKGSALAIYTAIVNPDSNVGFLCIAFAFACWIGLFIFALWTAFSFFRLEPTWPGTWLRCYWRNNVIGNDACIHLDKDGEYCTHAVKRGYKFTSWNCNNFTDENRFLIRLNLGGWGNRTLNLFQEIHNDLIDFEYWEIKLKRLGFYHEDITVIVRDGKGDSLCLEAERFLNTFNHSHQKRGGHAGDFATLLHDLLNYSNHKYNQWLEERNNAVIVEEKLRLAEDTIRTTLEDLDETRRFIKSKDAQEIREGLSARYDEIFPPEPRKSQAA